MVGRERELDALRQRWRRAAAGQGALITLVGAYGMGKTRVAAELAARLPRRGRDRAYASGRSPAKSRSRRSHAPPTRAGRRSSSSTTPTARRRGRAGAARARRGRAPGADDRHRPAGRGAGAAGADARRSSSSRSTPRRSRDRRALRPAGQRDPGRASCSGEPRRAAPRSRGGERMGAPRGDRRVDALAGRTAAGRSQARALAAELAGSVVDLQSTLRADRGAAGDVGAVMCPYKGLAASTPTTPTSSSAARGSSRSSSPTLVGAPLLARRRPVRERQVLGRARRPAARAGGRVLPGSQHWPQTVIRPGPHPLRELRAPARSRASAACSPSTSSRSCSRRARTSASGRRVRVRAAGGPAGRGRRARGLLRPLRGLPGAARARSGPTTCSSGR